MSVNIAVLVPANLAFTIKNTGAVPLGAYVIAEPTPNGFQPGAKLVVKDETSTPVSTADQEWSRIVRPLFGFERRFGDDLQRRDGHPR